MQRREGGRGRGSEKAWSLMSKIPSEQKRQKGMQGSRVARVQVSSVLGDVVYATFHSRAV